MGQTDIDFAVFLATRDLPRVRAERFVVNPRTTLRRNYENETENHLLLIRAQGRNEQRNK